MGVWDRYRIRTKVVAVIDKFGRVDPQQFKQLDAILKSENPEEVFEGLFAVLTSDKRFVAQDFAGRLLLEVAPSCPRTDLGAMLHALLSVWERSVEQVPWYFEKEFGTEVLHEAIRRTALRDLTPDEKGVQKHGYPDWGVRARMPSREEAIAALEDGVGVVRPFVDSELSRSQVLAVRMMLHHAERPRNGPAWQAQRCCKNAGNSLLFFGGDFGARAGIVNVFDLVEERWMARLEYRRRHVPKFPWDPKEGDAGGGA